MLNESTGIREYFNLISVRLLEIAVLVNVRFDSLKWVMRAASYKEFENIDRK